MLPCLQKSVILVRRMWTSCRGQEVSCRCFPLCCGDPFHSWSLSFSSSRNRKPKMKSLSSEFFRVFFVFIWESSSGANHINTKHLERFPSDGRQDGVDEVEQSGYVWEHLRKKRETQISVLFLKKCQSGKYLTKYKTKENNTDTKTKQNKSTKNK